ncbi:MAG: gamma-glutamyl-gamma-aminobutyrate hydrolase family protein [Vulcanimicrobiota bacterium]
MDHLARPKIGIPIPRDYFSRDPLWGNSGDYRGATEIGAAVARAGGEPVLLLLDGGFEEVQGLVLPGGADVDPALYGQTPHPEVREVDLELDRFQIGWTRWALGRGVPILGICRGMQVMNVAAGGTLVQHVSDPEHHFPEATRQDSRLKSLPNHTIALHPESLLAALLKCSGPTPVNSRHHQAVERLAPEFKATAWSEDGVVEAMDSHCGRHLGVQFHPEDLRHSDPRFESLFERLVGQARGVTWENLALSA